MFNINNLSHCSQVVRIQKDAVALWRHHLNSSSSLTLWWTICRSTSVKLWIFVPCKSSICVTQSSHKWIKLLSKNHLIVLLRVLNLKCRRYYNYNTLITVAPFQNNCSPKSLNTLLISRCNSLHCKTCHLTPADCFFSSLFNKFYFFCFIKCHIFYFLCSFKHHSLKINICVWTWNKAGNLYGVFFLHIIILYCF